MFLILAWISKVCVWNTTRLMLGISETSPETATSPNKENSVNVQTLLENEENWAWMVGMISVLHLRILQRGYDTRDKKKHWRMPAHRAVGCRGRRNRVLKIQNRYACNLDLARCPENSKGTAENSYGGPKTSRTWPPGKPLPLHSMNIACAESEGAGVQYDVSSR